MRDSLLWKASRILLLLSAFTFAVSLVDYAVVMFWPQEIFPYDLIYQFLISIPGYFAAATYYLATKNKRMSVDLLLIFAAGKYLAEHMFFVWLDLMGDLRQIYPWYTHNPLNPNGHWGYNWTVLGVEGTMISLAWIVAAYYVPGYLVARRLFIKK